MNTRLLPALCCLTIGLFAQPTLATFDPLNLTATTPVIESSFVTVDYVVTSTAPPDIASSFINVAYDSTSDFLTASGFANVITPPGSPAGNITGGSFDINATIDASGVAAAATLQIGGTVAALGFNSGTLLTATLSMFTAGAGDPLEFVFNVTGGDAAALMGPTVEVNLSQSGYTGSFASDFASAPFGALSDTISTQVPDVGGVLNASGFANVITPPGSPAGNIAGGSFDVDAAINDTDMTATGTLSIGGTIAGLGFNSGTLLTGVLSALGAGTGDPLEFLFDITGGDAAALMGPTVGVNLSQSGYTGSFASDFGSAPFGALADTFPYEVNNPNPVPEPGTLAMLAAGLVSVRIARRRSST